MGAARDLKEFTWVAVPKSLGGVLQLAFNFVLIHALDPEGFGIVSVCVTAIILSDAVLGPSVDLGVLRTAPRYRLERPDRSLRIQKTGLVLKLGGLLVAGAVIAWASRPLSLWLFQDVSLAPLLILSAASVFALGLLRSVQMHFQIDGRFEAYGLSDLLQSAIKYSAIAILVVTAPSPFWILTAHLVAPFAVGVGMLILLAQPLIRSAFQWSEARDLWRQVRVYAATTALGSTVSRIDVFFVTAVAGAAQAGVFSAAYAFAMIPQLIGMYMSVVFTPRIMPMWASRRLGPVYRRFQILLALICVAAFVGVNLGFRPVANLILPASFSQSTDVFVILLPAALCSLLNFPWTVSFLLFTRPQILLLLDLAALPVLVPTYIWAVGSSGAIGAAWVTTVYALVKTVIMQLAAIQTMRRGPREVAG